MSEAVLKLANGVAVTLRHSSRAKRMVLRVGRLDGHAVLTLPPGASLSEARHFVSERAHWLAHHQAAAPVPHRVAAGAQFPVAGTNRVITARPGMRHAVLEGTVLAVPDNRPAGPVVAAFLKARARDALSAACTHHVAQLARLGRPRRLAGLRLRDTRSRWGSCTMAGQLMFCWRLAMAPPAVLDYVAAHEVAHLLHMDHSPAFWAVVAQLVPDHAAHRQWLRLNGPQLMAWRFAAGTAA